MGILSAYPVGKYLTKHKSLKNSSYNKYYSLWMCNLSPEKYFFINAIYVLRALSTKGIIVYCIREFWVPFQHQQAPISISRFPQSSEFEVKLCNLLVSECVSTDVYLNCANICKLTFSPLRPYKSLVNNSMLTLGKGRCEKCNLSDSVDEYSFRWTQNDDKLPDEQCASFLKLWQ